MSLVKAINTGFARLSQEVFQNIQKINAHNKDQAQLLQGMLEKTISGFNQRIYTLSDAHFAQKHACHMQCQERTAKEVTQALATDKNLPLAEALSKDIQKINQDLRTFEVINALRIIFLLFFHVGVHNF